MTGLHFLSDAPRFAPGRLLITPAALAVLAAQGVSCYALIARHVLGDWGDLDQGDRALNESALDRAQRLLSSYHLPDGSKIWIVTEADRSATTVLLPSEY